MIAGSLWWRVSLRIESLIFLLLSRIEVMRNYQTSQYGWLKECLIPRSLEKTEVDIKGQPASLVLAKLVERSEALDLVLL